MSTAEGSTHVAGPDECISSIAEDYGFLWKTLWFHPNNAQLRALRKDPNVLYEGDEVYIPPKNTKVVEKPSDQRHKFIRKGIPSRLRLRLVKDEEPRANEPYTLTLDGVVSNGTTDGDGMIDIFIPPRARSGVIKVGTGKDEQVFELDLGGLDPITEQQGVIQRLENLGYDCGLDKETGLPLALKSFQADNDLPATGELDGATRSKLADVHGS